MFAFNRPAWLTRAVPSRFQFPPNDQNAAGLPVHLTDCLHFCTAGPTAQWARLLYHLLASLANQGVL